jgi:pantoate--beta-alanine ligase
MKIIQSIEEMQEFSESLRLKGQKIAFVPTMGYFHDGHLSLMKVGRERGSSLIVSIYVNPIQFAPSEDLEKYPRDLERDIKMADTIGVDVIFFPANEDMYPAHFQTSVNVEKVTLNLCGMSRPGHFKGVTTVCAKLFNIVKPHVAIFGQKDFQQLVAIRSMVRDLNIDLEIIGIPTVREDDGLAMSSRNVYLKEEERNSALSLSRSLKLAREMYEKGERRTSVISKAVREFIEKHPYTKIEYVKLCDATTLEDVEKIEEGTVLALAVKVSATRLIDNYLFGDILNI